jgi:hypothetical protein
MPAEAVHAARPREDRRGERGLPGVSQSIVRAGASYLPPAIQSLVMMNSGAPSNS